MHRTGNPFMSQKKADNITDSELFHRLTGEKRVAEAAFTELYARYGGRVYAYCLRFLCNREEAQDVFQETMIRFFECARQDREMTNIPGFLMRIARNSCLNSKRGKKIMVSFEEYHSVLQAPEPEKGEFLQLLTTALSTLPDKQREVFILREYQGFSYAEIAEIVDASIPSVKIWVFRAKQKIRKLLTPYITEMSE